MIGNPQITLYSRDIARALAFYEGLGFREAFRYPDDGPLIHIELLLDGFNLGIADIAVAAKEHGFDTNLGGHTIELVFWNDDTDALFQRLVGEGAPIIARPHDWLEDLRVAWIADPDGNPTQLVQWRGSRIRMEIQPSLCRGEAPTSSASRRSRGQITQASRRAARRSVSSPSRSP